VELHREDSRPILPKLVLDRETIRHLTPSGLTMEAAKKKQSKKCDDDGPTPTDPEPASGGLGGLCTRVDVDPCRQEKSRIDNPCPTDEPGPGSPGETETPGGW